MPSGPTDERPSRAFKATKAFAREARAVGLRVRTIRQERGWTLEQASERMQLELRHLQKIEAGEINVTLATFMRIAEGLREPLPLLFNKVAEPRTSYAPATSAKGEDTRRPEPQRTGSGNPKWGVGTFPGSPREADLVIRDVGTRLAEFRSMRNLTQVTLAESAGVALKYIQRGRSGSASKPDAPLAGAVGSGARD